MFACITVFGQPIGGWDGFSMEIWGLCFEKLQNLIKNLVNVSLKADVYLDEIFGGSGMNDENLCALKAKEGEWLAQWAILESYS